MPLLITYHPCIPDIAKRYAGLDSQVRRGTLRMDDAVERYATIVKDGTLGMAKLASAIPTEANDDDFSIPFIVTTLVEDRDGDVVVPRGCQLSNYQHNPVCYFGHQQYQHLPFPIAKCKSPDGRITVYPEENLIRAVMYFDRSDPDAMKIYRKVKDGFLNATSIAFVPIEAMRRDREAEKGLYESRAHTHSSPMAPAGWLFKSYDLTEISVVGVPANAGAIRDWLDTDKELSPRLQKSLAPYAAKALGRSFSGWCPPGTVACPDGTCRVDKSAGGPIIVSSEGLPANEPDDELPTWDVIVDGKAWGTVDAPDEETAKNVVKRKLENVRIKQMDADYGPSWTWCQFKERFKEPRISVKGPYGGKPRASKAVTKMIVDDDPVDRFEYVGPIEQQPPRERWNKSLSSAFDAIPELLMSEPEKVGAATTHRVAAKYLGCQIKDLHQTSYLVPSARMGSFLSGLKRVLAEYRCVETRNVGDRSEQPPAYETIQLNSKSRDNFLVHGTMFMESVAPRGKRANPRQCFKGVGPVGKSLQPRDIAVLKEIIASFDAGNAIKNSAASSVSRLVMDGALEEVPGSPHLLRPSSRGRQLASKGSDTHKGIGHIGKAMSDEVRALAIRVLNSRADKGYWKQEAVKEAVIIAQDKAKKTKTTFDSFDRAVVQAEADKIYNERGLDDRGRKKGSGPHNGYGAGIGDKRFVVKFRPEWGGLNVTVITSRADAALNQDVTDRAWGWAKANNFLKGEAFALSGEFLSRTGESWDDVFLEERNKRAVQRTLDLFNKKGLEFANRGVILTGQPGTGKTLSGRIIRNQAKGTFIWVSSRDFHASGSVGGLSGAFEMAKELAPAIVFMEDVDNWLDGRSVDLLKSEMDGIARSKGVLTILTTNFPEQLPEALIDRPGRFHDVLNFDLPAEDARRAMLRKWLPQAPNGSIEQAVEKSAGYSGAHVYELAHFARTLHEQDDLAPAEAVKEALAKVEQQRELITRLQLAGSNYDPLRNSRRRKGEDTPMRFAKNGPPAVVTKGSCGCGSKAACSCGKNTMLNKKAAGPKYKVGDKVENEYAGAGMPMYVEGTITEVSRVTVRGGRRDAFGNRSAGSVEYRYKVDFVNGKSGYCDEDALIRKSINKVYQMASSLRPGDEVFVGAGSNVRGGGQGWKVVQAVAPQGGNVKVTFEDGSSTVWTGDKGVKKKAMQKSASRQQLESALAQDPFSPAMAKLGYKLVDQHGGRQGAYQDRNGDWYAVDLWGGVWTYQGKPVAKAAKQALAACGCGGKSTCGCGGKKTTKANSSADEKMVVASLMRNGTCTLNDIRVDAMLSDETIKAALRRLIEQGRVSVQNRGGDAHYTLQKSAKAADIPLPARSRGGEVKLPPRNIESIRQHLIDDTFRGDRTVEQLPEFRAWLNAVRTHYMEMRTVNERQGHRRELESAYNALKRAYEQATGKKARGLREAMPWLFDGSDVKSLRNEVGKPFAGYKDFAACVRANSSKDDPEAYCATIMRNVEGKGIGRVGKTGPVPDPVKYLPTQQLRPHNRIKQALAESSGSAGGYTVAVDDVLSDPTVAEREAICVACGGSGECTGCGGGGVVGDAPCDLCGGSGECVGCAGSGMVAKSVKKSADQDVLQSLQRNGTSSLTDVMRDTMLGEREVHYALERLVQSGRATKVTIGGYVKYTLQKSFQQQPYNRIKNHMAR